MAALQRSPVAIHAKLLPSAGNRTLSRNPNRLSFSSSFPSLTLTGSKLSVKPKPRRGGVKMMDSAAGSYAAALGEAANTNGTLEATMTDMENLEKVFAEPAIFNYFENPTVGIEEKYKLVEEISSSLKLQKQTENFLNILVDVQRIDLIMEIIKEFEIVCNKLTGTELAVVTSVVKLEAQHLAKIAKQVQKLTGAKNVRIKTKIDPDLVAGFTVAYGSSGSKLVDMSVKKQLQEISSQLEFDDISLAAAAV